jgi:hypothetical protein
MSTSQSETLDLDSRIVLAKIAETSLDISILRMKRRAYLEELFIQYTEAENGPKRKANFKKILQPSTEKYQVLNDQKCSLSENPTDIVEVKAE